MAEWELDVALPAVPPTHIEESYKSWYIVDAEGATGNDLALRLHPNGLCVVTLAPTHAALHGGSGAGGGGGSSAAVGAQTSQEQVAMEMQGSAAPAAAAAPSDTRGGVEAEAEQQGGAVAAAPGSQQQAAAGGGSSGSGSSGPLLELSKKLLQAEFRRGRGPLLQAETILGRLTVGVTTFVLRCHCRGLLVELNSRLEGLQGPELLRELEGSYLAVLELRAAEAQQLAVRCLPEQQYQQQRQVANP